MQINAKYRWFICKLNILFVNLYCKIKTQRIMEIIICITLAVASTAVDGVTALVLKGLATAALVAFGVRKHREEVNNE